MGQPGISRLVESYLGGKSRRKKRSHKKKRTTRKRRGDRKKKLNTNIIIMTKSLSK